MFHKKNFMEKYYISILQYLVKEKIKNIKNTEISNFIKKNVSEKAEDNENINKILRNDYNINYKTVLNIRLKTYKRSKDLLSIFCNYQSYEDFKNKIKKEFLSEKNNEKKFSQKNDVFLKEIPEYFKNTKWYLYHIGEKKGDYIGQYIFKIREDSSVYLKIYGDEIKNYNTGKIYQHNNTLIVDLFTTTIGKGKNLHLKVNLGHSLEPTLMRGIFLVNAYDGFIYDGDFCLKKIDNEKECELLEVPINSSNYKKIIPEVISKYLKFRYNHKRRINKVVFNEKTLEDLFKEEKKIFSPKKDLFFKKKIPEYFENTTWYFYQKKDNVCRKHIFDIKENGKISLSTGNNNYENYKGRIFMHQNDNSFLIANLQTEESRSKFSYLIFKIGIGTKPTLMIGHYSIINSNQVLKSGNIILQKIENIDNINNVKAISVKIFSKDNETYNETYKKEIPKYIGEFLEKTYYEFKISKLIINLEDLENFFIKIPPP